MEKKRVMIVFGTRPEAIKMIPVINTLKGCRDKFDSIVCVTGQHREMLDQVLKIFSVQPDIDLNIMKSGQDLFDVTSRVLLGMRDALKTARPDLILVHGDTTTSMVAALAAFYERIPVGHVEAGLRTYNIYSPWPEEMNRQITGRIASINFAPTEESRQNLIREGVSESSIIVTGNTVIDTLYLAIETMEKEPALKEKILDEIISAGYDMKRLSHSDKRRLVLITGHRRENFGEGFEAICSAIDELSLKFPDVDFVYPVHLNPNVRKSVQNVFRGKSDRENLFLIEPLDYLAFVQLMKHSYLVLTDSGGIQEEAPGLGKPVLVMRDTTERPEAIQAGTVKLVGTDRQLIVKEVSQLLTDRNAYEKMANAVNPYGDGNAALRIVEALKSKF